MYLKEFSHKLSVRICEDVPETEDIVRLFVECVHDTLKEGHEINIPGFGVFYPKTIKGRMFKSYVSGQDTRVPDRTIMGFRPSRAKKLRKGD